MSDKEKQEKRFQDAMGTNLLIALGTTIVFMTSVVNCIVYVRGSNKSGTPAINNGVNDRCSGLMFIVNLIVAIVAFVLMLVYFYRSFTTSSKRDEHIEKYVDNVYYRNA
jgi:hypothetical protein